MLTDQWFRVVKQCPDRHIRLLCFPHAGGAASFFRSWADLVPDGVELVTVRYPGREDRLLHPLAETMEQLVEPIARECSRFQDAPLAFFGHSMGASVAYEVALRLEAIRHTTLTTLFVSGRAAPWQEKKTRGLSDASDHELIQDLQTLGGTEAQALADPELRDLYLPAIRADYRLVEQYKASVSPVPLSIPVVAYYGQEDSDLDWNCMAEWSGVTQSTFDLRSFDGGHFYLAENNNAKVLLEDLFNRLSLPTVN